MAIGAVVRCGRRGTALRRGLLLALLALILAACGVDPEQAQICEGLIPAFETAPERVEIIRRVTDKAAPSALLVQYRVAPKEIAEEAAPPQPSLHWIACRFGGRHLDARRFDLTAVATDRTGMLSDTQMAMLHIWLNLARPRPPADAAPAEAPNTPRAEAPPWAGPALYLLQQLVNSITLSCVYGLLAISYTLVYGIIGKINIAFGELYMIGAMITVIGTVLAGMAGAGAAPPVLLAVLAVSMGFTAVQGWTMERLVFRPLRDGATQAPLVAAIGLSVGLQEYVRLLQSADDRWLPPVFNDGHLLAGPDPMPVYVLTSQVLIILLTVSAYVALWQLLRRSAFGRAVRACADDIRTAALVGVDIDRTVSRTFMLGGVYAALAGSVIALYYGGVNFFMGFLIGFKALTAAVVGGIGSVPGAMLGGLLIGLLETFYSAYFSIEYKNVAVFAALALFLIFRPQGLLGQRRGRGD